MNRFQVLAAKWRREAAFAGWFCGGMGVLSVLLFIQAVYQSNQGHSTSNASGGVGIMGMFFIAAAYLHLVSRLAELAEECGKAEAAPKATNPDGSSPRRGPAASQPISGNEAYAPGESG